MARPLFTPELDAARFMPMVTAALATVAVRYPANFVVPNRQPYSYSVDMGLIRSDMAAGNTRQRRAYRTMPHYLQLSFSMRIEELYLWQNWVNEFAYSWILCPVSTMYAGSPPDPSNLRDEVLRFTSDLAISMDGWDWVSVTVTAELANDAQALNPPIGIGPWIVGGTPEAPNSDLWYIGGIPLQPSPEWAIGGTPAFPSSLI